MLHIILGILRIIGIIFGVLLLFLLAVLLAVIFVPIRYQVQAEKQEGRISARIKISWLLHIVSASLQVDRHARREIVIRLFGVRLPLFRPKKKKAGPKKAKRDVLRDSADTPDEAAILEETADAPDEAATMEEAADAPDETAIMEEAADAPDEARVLEEAVGIPQEDAWKETRDLPAEEPSEKPGSGRDDEKTADDTTSGGQADEKKSGSGKMRFSFGKICDKIKTVYGKLKALYEKLKTLIRALLSVPDRLVRSAEKVKALLAKPGQLLELARRLEVKEVLGDVLGYLRLLLKHYSPRKISGFLRFGTGDPAVTGQLAGLIYLILPARADQFTLQPEFGDTVFETDISFRGHIRAVHLLRVLWKGFRNKKLRRMIHYRTKFAGSEGA